MPNRGRLHCGCDSERSCDPQRHCAAAVGIDGSARFAEFTVACCLRSDAAFGSASGRGILYLLSWLIPGVRRCWSPRHRQSLQGAATCGRSPLFRAPGASCFIPAKRDKAG